MFYDYLLLGYFEGLDDVLHNEELVLALYDFTADIYLFF